MKLAFGFNTNGWAHHDLRRALPLLSRMGYQGVALTLDVHHLNPFKSRRAEVLGVARLLRRLGLRCVVETGARYLLDPIRKHEPTLISPSRREVRLDFLRRCVDIAAALEAEAISFWSGKKSPVVPRAQAWKWLVMGCGRVCDYAAKKRIAVGFEPEPGMLVATMADYDRLRAEVAAQLDLTLDVGHIFCTERQAFPKIWVKYAPLVRNVHIEDIRGGKHEHLMFGEGDIAFGSVLRAIKASRYCGLVNVELSRDSHRAPEVAERSLQFLRRIETSL